MITLKEPIVFIIYPYSNNDEFVANFFVTMSVTKAFAKIRELYIAHLNKLSEAEEKFDRLINEYPETTGIDLYDIKHFVEVWELS